MTIDRIDLSHGHARYQAKVTRERQVRDWQKSAAALVEAEKKAAARRLADETYEQFLIDGGWKKCGGNRESQIAC